MDDTANHLAPLCAPFLMHRDAPMGLAILGCGFVADFYMATRMHYPTLRVVGAYDHDPERLSAFSNHHGLKAFHDLDEVLRDPSVEIVLNLTNPRSHFELTKACLSAGKHVYSEKPLAMGARDAAELVVLAKQSGVYLATAPCSILGETAQTIWKALNDDAIGRVRLVYASYDDGMVHHLNPGRWRSTSGAAWPAEDEFETGCTYEHAGYVLSWLAAFFGPARRVRAYASTLIPDKGLSVASMAPDFMVGCIEYDNDVVARVTCSVVAPADKSLVIVGDEGILYTKHVRNDASPVYIRKMPPNRIVAGIGGEWAYMLARIEHLLNLPFSISGCRIERKYPFARRPAFKGVGRGKPVDFLRGPAELADSVRQGRPCRLSPELALHMTELIEALQYPERADRNGIIQSSFTPIPPLPWSGRPA